jgi:glycerol-3-phosphate dehydrogenase (NAD(P)+)
LSKIAILGGGSWGTALAIILSKGRSVPEISLWVHDPALAKSIRATRENKTYLPGCRVPAAIQVTSRIRKALLGAQVVIGAVPTTHARQVYSEAAPHVSDRVVIVSASKGLEPTTHKRISQVVTETCPNVTAHIAILSGPSFAAEAARGEPTAVVLAAQDTKLAAQLQEEFAAPNFRLYTNDDVLGVEVAGAMKNVIAIAAGVLQGLGLRSNSLAALITRGLAEMSRLVIKLGGQPETLSGLAGLGDLVLTCTGSLSRNRHVGMELAKGRALSDILGEMRMVAEGVGTTAPLLALASEAKVELPITQQVDAILHRGQAPREAIREIMERPQRRE